MFGIAALTRRVQALEGELARMKRDNLCRDGQHEWEAKMLNDEKAYLRCKHCFEAKNSKPWELCDKP